MKVYLSKQGFLLSYCEIILSQMFIRLPLIANSNSQKNTAFFFPLSSDTPDSLFGHFAQSNAADEVCVIVIHKGKLTDFDSEDAVTKDNLQKSGKNKRMLPFAFCLLVTVFCRWFMLHFSLNRYVLRSYNYSASLCYLLNVCGSRTLDSLSLLMISRNRCNRLCVMFSVFVDVNGHNRGPTFRPVVGPEK